jgi:predicted O-methyltransferase YrrM
VVASSVLVACGAPSTPADGASGESSAPKVQVRDPQAPIHPPKPRNGKRFAYRRAYRFTEDWFSANIPHWAAMLEPYMGKPDLRYLEVGVYEGRSLLWMIDHVLTDPRSRATGIDIHIPENLTHNLELSGASDRVTMLVGPSQIELRKLAAGSFDVVYIDGSHAAQDVLEDLVLSWRLLRPGGLMILDDYEHDGAETTGGTPMPAELLPRIAIDAFISAQRSYVALVRKGYQVALRKRRGVCPRGPWQCSSLGPYSYDWRLRVLYRGQADVPLSESERKIVERLIKAKRGDAQTLSLDGSLLESPELEALDARLALGLLR